MSYLFHVILGEGVPSAAMGAGQMAARAVVVYLAALVMIRVARRRFMGRNAATDVIVAVTFGSALSRTLTGNAPMLPVLTAGATLVAIDWALSAITARSDRLDAFIKGRDVELARDGRVLTGSMRGSTMSQRDLLESVRLQGKTNDVADVQRASLERNGQISVIPKPRPPRVVEVRVEAGVQTVRIELPGE